MRSATPTPNASPDLTLALINCNPNPNSSNPNSPNPNSPNPNLNPNPHSNPHPDARPSIRSCQGLEMMLYPSQRYAVPESVSELGDHANCKGIGVSHVDGYQPQYWVAGVAPWYLGHARARTSVDCAPSRRIPQP